MMSSPAATLIGVTLVLAGLVGILVVAVLRLRSGRARETSRERVSEEAFMATAIQEALAGRATASAPAGVTSTAPPPIDSALITHLPIGVLVVRQGGILSRINPAACRLLHIAPPAVPARLHDVALPEALVDAVEHAPGAARAARVRLESAGPDGVVRTLEADVSLMPAEPGSGIRILVVLTDFTERERRATLERRREAMAYTARLASALAHELANGLTGVHGYARMIDPKSLPPADRASLDALQKETDTLSEAIEGFRRVTRPLDLTRERFPIRWLVEDAVRHVVAELQVAADTVSVHSPEGLEVEGDRILLEEALMNVVRNAIEACTDAGIRPSVRVSAHASARGAAVSIVVEDNGPGLAPAERRKLWDPFFSTKPGRPGLGLARARHILFSHDGQIDASPASDQGLVVTMTLPLSDSA